MGIKYYRNTVSGDINIPELKYDCYGRTTTTNDGLTEATAVDKSTDILVANPSAATGWYWIKINGTPMKLWVDNTYSGGGWVLVATHPSGIAVPAVTYANGIGLRTTTASSTYGSGDPKSYSLWVGLQTWTAITSANSVGNNFVYFTAGSQVELGNTASHSRRSKWTWTGWSGTYAWTGTANLTNEVGGTTPGMWSYHIAGGYSFTTYDNDQDAYSGNCSSVYGNSPWWYGNCWDGNFWGANGAGGYANAPFWTGSGGDYYTYGAMYVK